MKYLVLLCDGMADTPSEMLAGATPMERAKKENMEALAASGTVGMVRTVPRGMKPGSDVANLSVMGYDPERYYTGRSPLEAANMGNKEAMAAVAYCYDYGHYVNQDSGKACQWWTKLANTGDGPACYFVAQYYADGNGVPQSTQTAIEWLNKCLEYGAGYVESDAQALLDELQGG